MKLWDTGEWLHAARVLTVECNVFTLPGQTELAWLHQGAPIPFCQHQYPFHTTEPGLAELYCAGLVPSRTMDGLFKPVLYCMSQIQGRDCTEMLEDFMDLFKRREQVWRWLVLVAFIVKRKEAIAFNNHPNTDHNLHIYWTCLTPFLFTVCRYFVHIFNYFTIFFTLRY